MMYLPVIFFLILIPIIGLWGARRVRRDVTRIAGRREEENEDERG